MTMKKKTIYAINENCGDGDTWWSTVLIALIEDETAAYTFLAALRERLPERDFEMEPQEILDINDQNFWEHLNRIATKIDY